MALGDVLNHITRQFHKQVTQGNACYAVSWWSACPFYILRHDMAFGSGDSEGSRHIELAFSLQMHLR